MMVGCGLRNGEARAVDVNNLAADDVYRVHEQIHSNTHRPAKLKHRKVGEFREVPLPRSVREAIERYPGKSEHHCTVIDAEGQRRLSRRVVNDETTLLELIGEVIELSEGEPVTWAIDLNAGGAALLIALLAAHGQKVLYIPGRTVHHASGSYRGDGKTDAKDAYVIADQARMRRDLHPLQEQDEIAVDLRILTARRYDLTADRTRAINRLRAQLLEYFPALERAFNYSTSKAALVLLTGYQTPAALRRIGRSRLSTWLANRKARNAQAVAATALRRRRPSRQ